MNGGRRIGDGKPNNQQRSRTTHGEALQRARYCCTCNTYDVGIIKVYILLPLPCQASPNALQARCGTIVFTSSFDVETSPAVTTSHS